METRNIVVKGARVHNLQNVDLVLPEGELICFTGVSGSGKSSMAFDTIYAEGQRRYVESLSAYARQFLGQFEKPDVDSITGLSPTVSIEQKTAGRNPRSTVGTMTEIYDYLRVLFARVGQPHCVACGTPIGSQTRDGIVDRILTMAAGTRFSILAPIVQGRKGEYQDLFDDLQRQGYIRARVDEKIVLLTEAPSLERHIRHDIEVVIDRLIVKPDSRARLGEAVDAALRLASGTLIVLPEKDDEILISASFSCPSCGLSATPPTPQLFSFNSPQGMCPTCRGMGTHVRMDERVAIPDPSGGRHPTRNTAQQVEDALLRRGPTPTQMRSRYPLGEDSGPRASRTVERCQGADRPGVEEEKRLRLPASRSVRGDSTATRATLCRVGERGGAT